MNNGSNLLSPPSAHAHGSGHLHRSSSRETLSAHPLLSPSSSSLAMSSHSHHHSTSSPPGTHTATGSSSSSNNNGNYTAPTKYLPYTPRQRVPTGSATTGTTTHSSVSVSPHAAASASATSKLQLQNLKAAAQELGLDTGSTGWSMLETLVVAGDSGPAWSEIYSAVVSEKATLLLPSTPLNVHETITPEFMKDHIVFCNASRKDGPAVTMSGLRGAISGNDLVFSSILPPTSKYYTALSSSSTRSSTILSLPPLPNTHSQAISVSPTPASIPASSTASTITPSTYESTTHNANAFPTYTLKSYSNALPIPPRGSSVPKPPLPPRPGARPGSSQGTGAGPVPGAGAGASGTPTASTATSRLSNPFASLFGRSSPTPAPSPAPVTNSNSSSPAPSINELVLPPSGSSPAENVTSNTTTTTTAGATTNPSSSTSTSTTAPHTSSPITVYTIDRPISRGDVMKRVAKAVKEAIRESFGTDENASNTAVPSWVVDRVIAFVSERPGLFVGAVQGPGTGTGTGTNNVGLGLGSKDGSKEGGLRVVSGTWSRREKTKASSPSPGSPAFNNSNDNNSSNNNNNNGNASSLSLSLLLSIEENAEDMARAVQVFYRDVEDGLVSEFRRAGNGNRSGNEVDEKIKEEDMEKEKEKDEKDAEDADALEDRVRVVMERVERTLCTIFYDRLFRPSTSDDPTHDEALSSRIAALNMLNLGLDHLGVDIGTGAKTRRKSESSAKEDVERVVEACGQTISQLEVAQCPADKAAILVAAHRIIVDGLSRLPPLKLKSEEESGVEGEATPKALEASGAPMLDHAEKEQEGEGGKEDEVEVKVAEGVLGAESSETATPDTEATPNSESDPSLPVPTTLDIPAAPDTSTSLLQLSPPPTPTPVSSDILLPLLIYSVVKSNPSQLVSHLLFIQRFRNESVGGEEAYCLINLMAVVEFLENVDLGALGLGDGEGKVISTTDLSPIPIPIARSPIDPNMKIEPLAVSAGLRGRVEQQVDAIAGSANKVISGVVDSSFGVLRALLPVNPTLLTSDHHHNHASSVPLVSGGGGGGNDAHVDSPLSAGGGRFGLLRRESVFSIASIAASLPGARDRGKSFSHSVAGDEEGGQEMVESRPGSIRELNRDASDEEGSGDDESGDEEGESGKKRMEKEDEDEENEDDDEAQVGHDARSIRSFESMMKSHGKEGSGAKKSEKSRLSISDRLSRMTRGGGSSQSPHPSSHPPIPESFMNGSPSKPPITLPHRDLAPNLPVGGTPLSSRTSSPSPVDPSPSSHLQSTSTAQTSQSPQQQPQQQQQRIPAPKRRFLECSADDLKLSEVPELLTEYKKLVEYVRALDAFE